MLDEAKKFHLRPDCRFEMVGPQFRMRTGKDENLIMVGGFGFQQKPLDIVEKYCPRTNTWSQLPVNFAPFIYSRTKKCIILFLNYFNLVTD